MKTKRPKIRKNITPAQFRNFIFAGHSIFTLENSETGNYITFRIRQIKKNNQLVPNQFAIQCKSLNDGDYGYQFLGFLNLDRKYFKRWGNANPSYIGYKTLYWLLNNLENLEKFTKLKIYHEGVCCKCGRTLTVPESIDNGIGPECMERILTNSKNIMTEAGIWDNSLTYDDNVRNALKTNPSFWSKLHVPDYIKLEDDFKGHRLIARLNIF